MSDSLWPCELQSLLQTSIHSSSGTLSYLIPWIYLSLPLCNHKGFDLVHTWRPNGFPYFFQLKSEFHNKEFMIWAPVSSWSCFCWLYRASLSSVAKNIINLFSVLTIWWCPCVESSVVLLEEGFAMTSVLSWQNSVSLCSASFCTPRSNLPVIQVSLDFLLGWLSFKLFLP